MTRDEAIEAGARAIAPSAFEGDPERGSHHARASRAAQRAAALHMAAAVLDSAGWCEPGDEHHTMDELYLYRMLYHAHAVNEWARHGTYPVVKSRVHSDGEPCFGGGWFIVVATLPTGQASNHYQDEHWDLFDVPEVSLPPAYDGHTPAEAAARLLAALHEPSAPTECDHIWERELSSEWATCAQCGAKVRWHPPGAADTPSPGPLANTPKQVKS